VAFWCSGTITAEFVKTVAGDAELTLRDGMPQLSRARPFSQRHPINI
jgi:hypothetical protein